MTSFVVDASVALKWFVPEADSSMADDLVRAEADLIAPGIIWTELANAVWKNARLGNLDSGIWDDVAAKLPGLMTIHSAEGPLLQSAVKLAVSHEHPVYDCVYLALAIQTGARVVTVDKRFLNVFGQSDHADRVISLEAAARQI
ncbi:MAG: type II toxin-antitoxin system VapC family toxin [Rhizobiaceae bacterium]